jgi:hypothetical protein
VTRAILLRLVVLALGMGLTEIGLTDALGRGEPFGWGLALLGGLPLVLAGTATFIGPIFGARRDSGDRRNG